MLAPISEVSALTHALPFSENHGSFRAADLDQGGSQEPTLNGNAHLCAHSRWQKEPIHQTLKTAPTPQEEGP